ncbi:right-handed parallel beta-helix repeat-containing protein [Desulfobacula toluolica]|uniref:Uncharacterized protein, putative surface association n=1 Tax=Desulfobacula toluolica (strain DSM 7467 / Tol2) TaxID=651182 RepID=K0NJY4_DESTT|nr:right-handed parallel beta-helix repeat-containing protein [Desulfobacula toluolica]CCK81816.1 uncharacterized protein, putative surface association [Desulfobacula toluolica Tol2]
MGGDIIKTKGNILIAFLLIIICFLLSIIYFQKANWDDISERNAPLSSVYPHGKMKVTDVIDHDSHMKMPAMGGVPNTVGKHPSSRYSADTEYKENKVYYIDNTRGNNRNSGTSIDKPWKDFSNIKKVSFAHGSMILLKRGEVWNNTLFTPPGGNEKAAIIIGSYGQGDLPVIDMQKSHSVGIRIYHSYISIQDLRIQNSAKTCVAVSAKGFKNIQLKNLEILNSGNNGISVHKGGTGLNISGCYIENSDNNGIHLGGSAENKLSNVVISECHIKTVLKNDGITIHEDGFGHTAGFNFLLKNNFAEMCAEEGFDITTGRDILLLNNRSDQNQHGGVVVGHSAQNVTIRGHISSNEPTKMTSAAINLAGGSGTIRLMNSIIKGDGYHLLLIRTSNIAVFNNNFIWNGGSAPIDISGKIDNVYFINNIIASKQNKMSRIRFLEALRPPDHSSFYFDYNLYYTPDNHVVFYHNKRNYDFKQYQNAFKVDQHSRNINPEFADFFQDEYHLRENSPAINHGCFYTSPVSQEIKNQLVVNNALFFYKNINSDHTQCIMFKGLNKLFHIVDVDYKSNIILLNEAVDPKFLDGIGGCYHQSGLDIGAHEFMNDSKKKFDVSKKL